MGTRLSSKWIRPQDPGLKSETWATHSRFIRVLYNLEKQFHWVPGRGIGYNHISWGAKACSKTGPSLLSRGVASQTQSLVDRAHRDPGDVYGGARHLHRERGLTPYGGDSGRQPGRSYLGPDQLPGFQRHRVAYLRLALYPLRPQAVLHDLCGPVYHLFAALRDCAYLTVPHSGQDPAGPRRWRTGSQRTGDPGRYVSGGTTRPGIRPLWHGGGGRTRDRADPGRLDHRQLQLALDLLH